jgi:hypothetical protein
MAILVHSWVSDRFHGDSFNRIISDPQLVNSGYLVILDGEVLVYKWPRRNSLILRSPSIASRNYLAKNVLNYMRSLR